MQFKSLLFALAAVAATATAQGYTNNACSQCAFGSITKEPTCASLVPVDMLQLQSGFANGAVNVSAISTATQNPAIKNCLCHWSNAMFSPTSAAAPCAQAQGAIPAICNATQVAIATAQIAPFAMLISCNGTTGGNSTAGSTSTNAATGPNSAAGSLVALNMPYIASIAALGLAALAGL